MSDGPDRYIRLVELHGFVASVDVPIMLKERIDVLFSAYPAPQRHASPLVQIRADQDPGASTVWFISDGATKERELSADQASTRIEWFVISRALDQWSHFIHVHAGLVANELVSALLIGRSGSGKSTTTVGLATKGLKLYSDDVALIDRSDFTAWACPRPIKLDDDARDRLHSLGIAIQPDEFVDESVNRTVLPGMPDVSKAGPRVVAAFFFSGRRDAVATITPITKSEAVLRLTWQSTTEEFGETGPSDGAVAFVETLHCYELTPGQVEDTVELVRSTLEDLGTSNLT